MNTQLYEIWPALVQWPAQRLPVVACRSCAALYLHPMYGVRVAAPASPYRCQVCETGGRLEEKEPEQLRLWS